MGTIGAMSGTAGTMTGSAVAARAAAAASIGAAMIHTVVIPSHWREWLPAGLFFATIAVFQLIWAILAWARPPAALLATGIAANVGLVALWVMSRTAGAPFGPHAGQPEMIRGADICALLLEFYIVMGATWAWHRSYWPDPVSGFSSATVLLGANTVVAAAVMVAVASTVHNHGDHHVPAETLQDGRPAIATPSKPISPVPTESPHRHQHG